VLNKEGVTAVVSASDEQMADSTTVAKQQYLAIAYLAGSDRSRYGKLLEDLKNPYICKDVMNTPRRH
jgi:hypothetical protein